MNASMMSARKVVCLAGLLLGRAWLVLVPAETDPATIIEKIRTILMGWVTPSVAALLAIVFIIGGVMWLTAGPNQGQVRKAQQWLKNGAIGGGIIMGAVLLADLVVSIWTSLIGDGGGGGGGGG